MRWNVAALYAGGRMFRGKSSNQNATRPTSVSWTLLPSPLLAL